MGSELRNLGRNTFVSPPLVAAVETLNASWMSTSETLLEASPQGTPQHTEYEAMRRRSRNADRQRSQAPGCRAAAQECAKRVHKTRHAQTSIPDTPNKQQEATSGESSKLHHSSATTTTNNIDDNHHHGDTTTNFEGLYQQVRPLKTTPTVVVSTFEPSLTPDTHQNTTNSTATVVFFFSSIPS